MKNFEIYTKWISDNINSENFLLAFLFGSVARNVENPNDCDLLLVTKLQTNSDLWKLMRMENEVLKQKFYTNFELELSIQLLSEEEFSEDLSFIKLTLKSPIIVLINKLDIK
jgi:predicted nucleotidyltransferase